MRVSRLGAIFGNGRSGTTWLGAIVSSHPEVAYRFEPFKRAAKLDDEYAPTAHMLDTDRLDQLDAERLYDALLPALPDWDKPPFFDKKYRVRFSSGRALLWPASRKSAVLNRLFRALYTPLDEPFLVFKEVAYEDAYRALVESTQIPIVYLVRHPCAIVNSLLRGQEQGLMGVGRQNVIPSYLQDNAPALWETYREKLASMRPHQKEALLWRANVERCFEVSASRKGSITTFYENLCRDTMAEATRVLDNFGLDLRPQVEGFIEASTRSDSRRRGRIREIGINRYFSVFRDPEASMNQWREELAPAEQLEVLELVRDSPVFESGRLMAHWDD